MRTVDPPSFKLAAVTSATFVSVLTCWDPDVAETLIEPAVASTFWSALMMYASTSLATSLRATVTTTPTATPIGAIATVSEAPTVIAVIEDVSSAVIATLFALIPLVPSPSMYAFTRVPILLVVAAPAPLTATPTPPPVAAALPAAVTARTTSSAVALIFRSPLAVMLEFETYARTSAGHDAVSRVQVPPAAA